MAKPSLQLLGHGVHVAEAALQRMVLEDRGGARGVMPPTWPRRPKRRPVQ
jgi:hypothetical protein